MASLGNMTMDARECMANTTITVRLRGLLRFRTGVWIGLKLMRCGVWFIGANYCFVSQSGDEQSSLDD